MKTIAGRGRKILGMIFRGISVSVVSLILQACFGILLPDEPTAAYGMPPPSPPEKQETSIRVKVKANETGEPIFGIKVSIEGTKYWDYTNKEGYFSVLVPTQNNYRIKLEDVDGPAHGGLFKGQTRTIKQENTYNTLLIFMDLDPTQPGTQPGTSGTQTGCCKSESETETNGGQVEVE